MREAGIIFVGPRPRRAGPVRRQGAGPRARSALRRARARRNVGADDSRRGAGVPRGAGRGRGGGDQGGRRRRRPRHAGRAPGRRRSTRRTSAAGRRRCRRSARATSTSSSCCRARGTSRSRCWATAPAPSAISGSASARSSGGIRSWSRSRPAQASRPACATRLLEAALRVAREVRFDNLGTFEFLVDATTPGDGADFAFIEANPRLQVEHTVTEEVTGLDLVRLQLRLAAGCSLAELGLEQAIRPRRAGSRSRRASTRRPSRRTAACGRRAGRSRCSSFPPARRPRRYPGHAGYRTNPRFDSLLAKVVGRTTAPRFARRWHERRARWSEFRIEGVATNITVPAPPAAPPRGDREPHRHPLRRRSTLPSSRARRRPRRQHVVGSVRRRQGRLDRPARRARPRQVGRGTVRGRSGLAPESDGGAEIVAPMQGTIVSIDVREGDPVYAGTQLLVMEAMKMEHVVGAGRRRRATRAGRRRRHRARGHPLVLVEDEYRRARRRRSARGGRPRRGARRPGRGAAAPRSSRWTRRVPMRSRAAARPASAPRARTSTTSATRARSSSTARSAIAAQRRRRPVDELIERTPGRRPGRRHRPRQRRPRSATSAARCVVMSYDYTVLAGTQGLQNHRKKDRMFELAERVAPAGGVLRRRRRRAVRATPTPRRVAGARHAWPSTTSAA